MPIQLTGSLDITGSLFLNGTAVTASGGGGGTVDTGSLMVTGSVTTNVLTFTKGDGSTFALTVDTGSGGGGAAFPYTGSAEISGSLIVTGSTLVELNDNQDFIVSYRGVTNSSSPNIGIGSDVAAFDATGGNNIIIGSGQNAALSTHNRFIGVTGTNYSNIIAGGLNNYISGSASLRIVNSIIGGSGNTIGRNNLAVALNNNGIFSSLSSNIYGGSFNGIIAGSSNNIFTGSLDTSPSWNVILGGSSHDLNGSDYSAFVAGFNNAMTDTKQSVIVGGENNTITQTSALNDFDSVIVGGRNNTITDHARSVILGGDGLSTSKADEVVVPNLTISGSVVGEVNALVISSNTASLDLSTGNFYTLQLVEGTDTLIEPSNIQAGQTVNLRINTTGSATVSFPASVLQQSGSAYVPTTTDGIDVVTFISFDATSLLLSNVKNLV